ncbi:ribosomal protein S5 domain 2-like protein [Rozella allomycis CSF55]|uniref:Ribosomal RNA-processing protein 41 n=1 Tax=Rozella allomycis (strain CSF55) TaxID=988480 RepID=A0A075B1F0_ROZAC|nr:Exoribonuclease, phosphorolytic 1 domain-containing protein [Rozella allomycis CSF55]RKP17244.1 ribosomal protein S5 domain 2-like protein [Rozella allomycis CSF55]|eukprot:EPZ36373.1 Exoribonuclease, phosphorolytic 1 domain-containing protein [Rozella allomycis CSF55]
MSVFQQADGSCYLEQGNTKLLACVYGPREVEKRHQLQHDKAIITTEISMSTFTKTDRRKARVDKRLMEMSIFIKQTMESVVKIQLFPRSQIDIYIQVIQVDGGLLSACVNAVTLALIDAGIPMTDYITASTIGYIKNTPFLDMNAIEESSDTPVLTIAIQPRDQSIVLFQLEKKIHVANVDSLIEVGLEGCKSLHKIFDERVKQRTKALLEMRGF